METATMGVERQVRSYILENYLFTDDPAELNSTDSFLELGIIDSLGVLQVIDFLEKAFDIKVNDEEMIPENLDSVNSVVAFVERKTGGAGS
jgi:acyl carrier protein